MSVITVYARLYGECFSKTMGSLARNAWTVLLPMGMFVAMVLLMAIIASIGGFLAGILTSLALSALYSSYLYFVSEVVSNQKVGLHEVGRSIKAYFWSILNVLFVLFIAQLLLGLMLRGTPQGGLILTGLWLVAVVVLNPAPEVIYQRHTYGGLQTLQGSWEFLKENWIEWFVPNVPLLLAVAFVTALASTLHPIAGGLIGGALFHVVMIYRGHLFRALDGSSHRQRMFRFRNG